RRALRRRLGGDALFLFAGARLLAAAFRDLPALGESGLAAVGPHPGLCFFRRRAPHNPLRQSQELGEAAAAGAYLAAETDRFRLPLRLRASCLLASEGSDQREDREHDRLSPAGLPARPRSSAPQ